jgi:hypothetical protein
MGAGQGPAPHASKRSRLRADVPAGHQSARQAAAAFGGRITEVVFLDALASAASAAIGAAVIVVRTEVVPATACARAGATDTCAAPDICFAPGALCGAFAPAPLLRPPLPASERATLAISATCFAGSVARDLDLDIAILCDTEFGAGQDGERADTPSEPLDRGSPVSLRGDHPRPVIEATIVHAVPTVLTLTTSRTVRRTGRCHLARTLSATT